MGHRLTRLYTRTGDEGTTGLSDGTRLPKDHPRVTVMGEVDELNSYLGLLITQIMVPEMSERLHVIQHDLLDVGGELSIPGHSMISAEQVQQLERWLEEYNAQLPPLKEFILPGGGQAAAVCHVARAVCRRAERSLATLQREETVNPLTLPYLNRLSDLLFVVARVLARVAQGSEVLWNRSRHGAD